MHYVSQLLLCFFVFQLNANERIVSLAPHLTEILYALGAGNEVVGVTTHCDYPKDAQLKTKIGTYIKPNLEAILKLKPTLVLATKNGNPRDRILKLKRIFKNVKVVHANSVDDILKETKNIALWTNHIEEGNKLLLELNDDIELIRTDAPKLSKLTIGAVVSFSPLMLVGNRGFIDNGIRFIGASNVLSRNSQNYARISLESLISMEPNFLLYTDMGDALSDKIKKTHLYQTGRIKTIANMYRPTHRFIKALRNIQLMLIKESTLSK